MKLQMNQLNKLTCEIKTKTNVSTHSSAFIGEEYLSILFKTEHLSLSSKTFTKLS